MSSPPEHPFPVPAAGRDVLTREGRVAVVRPVRVEDLDQMLALHAAVGEVSQRFRFFSPDRGQAEDYARHLAALPPGVLCLVAVLEGVVAGVASGEPAGEATLEVALLVADPQHGHGLGSLLLEHLADRARARGVRRFVADVLLDNTAMQHVFVDAGFAVHRVTEAGVVGFELDLTLTPEALDAADHREELAQAASLRPLLHPRSVVVVGVRRDGTGVGAAVVQSIRDGGFRGALHVVHPTSSGAGGVLRSCRDLPAPADLAVMAVPADRVLAALGDAVAGGVRAAVVLTSGFAELGPRGDELQRALVRLARDNSVRLVGPNCLGVVSTQGDSVLDATFAGAAPLPGHVALASQSGGVGIVVMEAAARLGLGIASFVSLGNKADVSGNDLLAAWSVEEEVSVVCLYLESFGNAHKLARIARRVSRRKPVLAVVGGRSDEGRRAGASHTAAAASPAVLVDAVLDHAGVVRCHDATDLAATALLLDGQPLPRGRRIGIVTNAGGIGVLAADRARELGLDVPRFTPEWGARLPSSVASVGAWGNPVDTGAGAGARELARSVGAVLEGHEVDAVLVVVVATSLLDVAAALEQLTALPFAQHDLPVLLVVLGTGSSITVRVPGTAVLTGYEEALLALAHAADHAEWKASRAGPSPTGDLRRSWRGRTLAREVLGSAQPDGWVTLDRAVGLLRHEGLELVGELVRGPAQAVAAAERTGFPVVVKAVDRAGVHKTEAGLVRVGLTGAEDVGDTVERWSVGGHPAAVLVQPVVQGVEIAVGLVRDHAVGAVVMVAAGGVDVDVWDDRQFLLAPVWPAEAEQALRRLRTWPLLAGHRGSPPLDVAALVDVVVRVGRLGDEVPEVAELDLNPVVVTTGGVALVDARVRVTPSQPFSEAPSLRGTSY
ncbi:MAG: GCN5-related N-acetyltransferase [Marmoricola sp.]|nr:GCN5-related N-acetyltransferase [Marmoricola sp.]